MKREHGAESFITELIGDILYLSYCQPTALKDRNINEIYPTNTCCLCSESLMYVPPLCHGAPLKTHESATLLHLSDTFLH